MYMHNIWICIPEWCACSVMSGSVWPHGLYPIKLFCPGRNTGVNYHHYPLQGVCPAPRLKLCLLYWQVDSLPLSHLGSKYNQKLWIGSTVITLHYIVMWESQITDKHMEYNSTFEKILAKYICICSAIWNFIKWGKVYTNLLNVRVYHCVNVWEII